MSKIADTKPENLEEDTTVSEKEVKIEPAVKEKKTDVKSAEKKMSVTAYLQLKPQNSTITLLLKKNYAMKFYTESQWNDIVKTINNKKTK